MDFTAQCNFVLDLFIDVVMDDLYPGGNHGDDLEDIGTVIEDDDVAAQSQEKENARVNVRITVSAFN